MTYGVYVLGVEHGGEIEAATVTWVSQSSFKPPQVMLGVKKAGRPFALLSKSRKLALSILGEGQGEVAQAFFKGVVVEGATINGQPFEKGQSGAPILTAAPAWIEAEVVSIDESGDHAVVVALVVGAGVRSKSDPLSLRSLGLSYGG